MYRLGVFAIASLVEWEGTQVTDKTPAQRQLDAEKRKALENAFETKARQFGLPAWDTQYKLPGRRFRWDFAWPEARLLVEVNGGTWSKRRKGHSSGSGIARDYEKANTAALAGYYQLTFDAKMVRSGEAAETVAAFLKVVSV